MLGATRMAQWWPHSSEKDVLGLEVAMDDAGAVQERQATGDVNRDALALVVPAHLAALVAADRSHKVAALFPDSMLSAGRTDSYKEQAERLLTSKC